MSDAIAHKGGKKNRKFGRHKTRSPAAARYRNTGRMVLNKMAKIAKEKARPRKVLAVKRGSARAWRRSMLTIRWEALHGVPSRD